MLQSGHAQSPLYQQAVLLTKEIYGITDAFPITERAVLMYNLRHLAILLCQDVAMALVKKGKKEKRFFCACLDHCVALDAQLELALAVGLLHEAALAETTQLLQAIYQAITIRVQQV